MKKQIYYRLRMQALKWYLFALDEEYQYIPEHHQGPFKSIQEAETEAAVLRHNGIKDLDREDNVPRGSQFK